MKINAIALLTGGIFVAAGLLRAQTTGDSNGDPFTPVGSLQVTPTVVQPGVYPEMTWSIDYPKSIPDLVVIDSNGGMTTINDKTDRISIRVAGASYESEGTELPVALWVSVDGGSWDLIHYGTGSDVTGDDVFEQNIAPGTKVDLAARGRNPDGGWTDTHWTLSDSSNLAALIDEDPLPSESSAFSSGDIEDFMTPYVDENNNTQAGPRDIIHVFEVESTSPGSSSFDMQDIVVVTTFGKNNNGHGNNLDGVDMSNKGNSTGTAGSTETDPYIDDEQKWIKNTTTTTTTTTTTSE